ncbi:MAG: hypothetical protein WBA10_21795 [Elainellaceae cyanobacterium]
MAALCIAAALSPLSASGEDAVARVMPLDSVAEIQHRLYPLQPHPLPGQLERACNGVLASDPFRSRDAATGPAAYFDAIRPLPIGYLTWTDFPISVYVEPLTEAHETLVSLWQNAAAIALQDWGQYLPIDQVSSPAAADIQLRPVMPPLRYAADGTLRAQSGEASYDFYLDDGGDGQILRHRFTVSVKPGQAPRQLEASIRHELGHAFGLWGHSSDPNDALYYSQVRVPSPLSSRDVATLCEVYRQPTAIGWPLKPSEPIEP